MQCVVTPVIRTSRDFLYVAADGSQRNENRRGESRKPYGNVITVTANFRTKLWNRS